MRAWGLCGAPGSAPHSWSHRAGYPSGGDLLASGSPLGLQGHPATLPAALAFPAGAVPATGFLKQSGINIDSKGFIVVNKVSLGGSPWQGAGQGELALHPPGGLDCCRRGVFSTGSIRLERLGPPCTRGVCKAQPWVLWLGSGSELSWKGVDILGGEKWRKTHLSKDPKRSLLSSPPLVTPVGAVLVLKGGECCERGACRGAGAHRRPPRRSLLMPAISQAPFANTDRPYLLPRASSSPFCVSFYRVTHRQRDV